MATASTKNNADVSTSSKAPKTAVSAPKGAGLTEFNPRDPQTLLATAKQLAQFVTDNKLASTIQGRAYVQCEGWQFLFAVAGLDVICAKPSRLQAGRADTEICYEAEARLFDADGREVGYGAALCSTSESSKRGWAEYAIMSMAQTRAIGKAGRNRFAFVMKAAGFEPTPAEEMSDVGTSASVVSEPKKSQPEASAPASAPQAASTTSDVSIAGPVEIPAEVLAKHTRQIEACASGIDLQTLWGKLTGNEKKALFEVKETKKAALAAAAEEAKQLAARQAAGTMRVAGKDTNLVEEFITQPVTEGVAVVVYATTEQRQCITRLLDNPKIARKEKTYLLLGINKLDKERARQAIVKLRQAIAEREGVDPLVGVRAQVVAFVQRNAGKLSATQAEGLTSLAASPEATLEFLLDALDVAQEALIDDETYGTDEELAAGDDIAIAA